MLPLTFSLFSIIAIAFNTATILNKPYTLQIPIVLPINGQINPTNGICTNIAELAASDFNNQSKYLPDYNVIFDLIDDQCHPIPAVNNLVPFYRNWKPTGNIEAPSKYRFPANYTFLHQTAEVGLNIPLIGGPICSGPCKVINQLPEQFTFIQTTVGCIDLTVKVPTKDGHFYRLGHSVDQEEITKTNFLKMMNWTQVSIISDTSQFTYQATSFLTEYAWTHNITMVAETFFSEDPSEAIDRLIAVDARIIIANCYMNTCPKVLCEAYKKGLYGPTIIWIFSGGVDVLKEGIPRTEGCTVEMTNEVVKNSIQIGVDYHGIINPERRGEFGWNVGDLADYIGARSPEMLSRGNLKLKDLCYEIMVSAGMVLDTAEKLLKKRNPKNSLRQLLLDKEKRIELEDILRQGVFHLDYNAMIGQSKMSSKSTDQRYFHSLPRMMVAQHQEENEGLVQNLVYWTDDMGNNQFRNPLVWSTVDGKAPLDELEVIKEFQSISSTAMVIGFVVTGFSSVVLLATVILMFKSGGSNEKYVNNFQRMNWAILLGCLPLLVSVFTFVDMNLFCKVVPTLFVVGGISIIGGLSTKLLAMSLNSSKRGPISKYPCVKKKMTMIFIAFALAVLALHISMEVKGLKEVELKFSLDGTFTWKKQSHTVQSYQLCVPDDMTLGIAVFGSIIAYGLFGSFASITIRVKQEKSLYIADLKHSQALLFVLIPLTMVFMVSFFTIQNYWIQFTVAVLSSSMSCLLICTLRWVWDFMPLKEVIFEDPNRSDAKPKWKAKRRPF